MKCYAQALVFFFISVNCYSQQSIESKNISNFTNDSVRVIGKVSSAYYSPTMSGTVLEVQITGTSTFDVVIKNEDRSKFKFSSETEFVSKAIAVTGKVVLTSGRYKIYINSNEQLNLILGERVQ